MVGIRRRAQALERISALLSTIILSDTSALMSRHERSAVGARVGVRKGSVCSGIC